MPDSAGLWCLTGPVFRIIFSMEECTSTDETLYVVRGTKDERHCRACIPEQEQLTVIGEGDSRGHIFSIYCNLDGPDFEWAGFYGFIEYATVGH